MTTPPQGVGMVSSTAAGLDAPARDRSAPSTPPEGLPVVKWTTRDGNDYTLGMTVWRDIAETRFDLKEGDPFSAGEFICSNLTVDAARSLRANLDRFLTACDGE